MSAKAQSKKSVNFRLELGLIQKLDSLAEATGRDKTFLATEALEQYIDLQAWQVAQIKKGIEAADAGLLYTTDEVLAELEAENAKLQLD